MNFQQLKVAQASVFVFIAVWLDVARFWVIKADELTQIRGYSKGQHRGNVGEGQIHMKPDNIQNFARYEVQASELEVAVRAAYQRLTRG